MTKDMKKEKKSRGRECYHEIMANLRFNHIFRTNREPIGQKVGEGKMRLLRKKRPLEMGEERVELTCKRKKDLGHSG